MGVTTTVVVTVSFLATAVCIFRVERQEQKQTMPAAIINNSIERFMLNFLLFTGMTESSFISFCNNQGVYFDQDSFLYFLYHQLCDAVPVFDDLFLA